MIKQIWLLVSLIFLFSVGVASGTHSLILGFLMGILAGMLLGALHAVLSIRYRINQIISGTGIIILALGITNYFYRAFLNPNPALNNSGAILASLPIPLLWRIPVIGPILFNQSPVIYIMFLLILFTHFFYNYTKWGLRIRAVGENPKAADTLGINVFKLRYISVLASGAIAGFAGAYMSIGQIGFFQESMISRHDLWQLEPGRRVLGINHLRILRLLAE